MLDGFRGRSLGLIGTCSKQVGTHLVSGDVRWVHEFDSKNRIEGDVFSLNLSIKL